MLQPLVLALVALGAGDGALLLQAHEDAGFVPITRIGPGVQALVPIPLVCRSPRVGRATPAARGIGLRLSAEDPERAGRVERLEVAAVCHRLGTQVLLDQDGLAVLVGAPELPARVAPELVRQDGVGPGPEGAGLELGPLAAGRSVVLVRLEDASYLAPARQARVLTPAELERARLADFDQLFVAEVGRVGLDGTSSAARPLALRSACARSASSWQRWQRHGLGLVWRVPLVAGAERALELGGGAPSAAPLDIAAGLVLELWFAAPPDAAEGETWTLLVALEGRALGEPGPGVGPSADAPDEPARALFRDATNSSGARHVHFEGPDEQEDIRPTMGPGAAFGDVDQDGLPDLYLVQGGGRAGSAPAANRLLRNAGGGAFAAYRSGAEDEGAGMGALFFDAEGDADLDLYVANYGADALFQGDGRGSFEDVRAAAGVGGERWSSGVAAADADRDGDLDLYVASYLRYDPSLMPSADELGRFQREDPIAMLPFAFPGERNTYLRNESSPTRLAFSDATDELGLADAEGRGLQPVFFDFDRDGAQDLYVANDVSYNRLWRNDGSGRFRDVSFSTGMDDPRGGMGVAVGDVDLDGDEDLFLTNWQLEANALYINNHVARRGERHRVASFRDAIVPSGLGPFGIGVTSWGAELFDGDLDGDLDLFVANGYTSPDYASTGICVGQQNHYFENESAGRFRAAFAEAGPALLVELPSRAALACDWDRDGDVDLVVTANNASVQLLESRARELFPSHRWLGVRLSAPPPNPFAIGAEVELEVAGRTQRRALRAGTSYLAGNPPELHFGLGPLPADASATLRVRWPAGATSAHVVPALDAWITLEAPR